MLQPVAAEAAARWSATGLTAEQAATLANVQFAVADLGGAYLGLANPATNTVRIDDDAAMFGCSVIGDRSAVIGSLLGDGRTTFLNTGHRSPITENRSPITGVDLLTVVMHELGHLLGYGHSGDADNLMAPVLAVERSSAEAVEPLGQAQWRRECSRWQRYEREADEWFTELAVNDFASQLDPDRVAAAIRA